MLLKRNNKNSSKIESKETDSDFEKKKFFIDNIAKYCDKCGFAFTTTDITLLQETNVSSIIHFSCSNCKANHIATFIRPMNASSRVPVISDLEVEEISTFSGGSPISSDDVLEIFNQFENNDNIKDL